MNGVHLKWSVQLRQACIFCEPFAVVVQNLYKNPETWWQSNYSLLKVISSHSALTAVFFWRLFILPNFFLHQHVWDMVFGGWTCWPRAMQAYSEGSVLVLIQKFEDCCWLLQCTAPLLSSDVAHISICLSLAIPDMLFSWWFSVEQIPSSAPVEQIAAWEERVLTTD